MQTRVRDSQSEMLITIMLVEYRQTSTSLFDFFYGSVDYSTYIELWFLDVHCLSALKKSFAQTELASPMVRAAVLIMMNIVYEPREIVKKNCIYANLSSHCLYGLPV